MARYDRSDRDNNTRLFNIANLSPLARKKLDDQGYHFSVDTEEEENQSVLDVLFLSLVADLKDIGIVFKVDAEEFYSNGYILDQFLVLLDWIMPNRLYPKMLEDKVLTTALSNIVGGTIGVETPLYLYLDWLGNTDIGYVTELNYITSYMQERCTSSPVFVDYLKGLLLRITERQDKNLHLTTPETLDKYHDTLRTYGQKLNDFTSVLGKTTLDINKEALNRRLKVQFNHFKNPLDVNKMTFIMTTDRDTLATHDRPLFFRILKSFYSGLKIHPLYYTARNLEMTKEDALGCVAFAFMDAKHKDMFKDNINIIKSHITSQETTQVVDDFIAEMEDEQADA